MQTVFRPIFFSLVHQGLNVKQIGRDVMAGIVVGIVALPLAIAFAVASGVSPEKGIITAIVAGFLISLLGGSRVQIGGPTGAFIVIVYGIVEQYGVQGLLISTVMAGVGCPRKFSGEMAGVFVQPWWNQPGRRDYHGANHPDNAGGQETDQEGPWLVYCNHRHNAGRQDF